MLVRRTSDHRAQQKPIQHFGIPGPSGLPPSLFIDPVHGWLRFPVAVLGSRAESHEVGTVELGESVLSDHSRGSALAVVVSSLMTAMQEPGPRRDEGSRALQVKGPSNNSINLTACGGFLLPPGSGHPVAKVERFEPPAAGYAERSADSSQ